MAIKPEPLFGLDNFGKPKTLTVAETVAQMVLNILLLKPGQLPSLPHIGIDIKKYLYKFEEDIDPEHLKSQLIYQCNSLNGYIDLNNIDIILLPVKNESILFISIPLIISKEEDKDILIAFKYKKTGKEVTFNYKIANSIVESLQN